MLVNTFAFWIAAILSAVDAQSLTTSASAAAQTHVFSVGADGKTFTPHNRTIPVGDIAEFRFYPLNHSVVKGEFGPEPCIPYELTGAGKKGWWSGWMPTAVVDIAKQPVFRVLINESDPLAVYCSSPGSCLHGMLAVINGNETHNYESQLAYTVNATASLSPGEYWPEEKLPEDPKPTGGSTNEIKEKAPQTHSLGAGAIAGIAIGGAALLLLAGVLLYMCGRQKSFKDLLHHNSNNNASPGAGDNTTAYTPASPGFSEAHYPNMAKSPALSDARFSEQSYGGADSYRSVSPPLDERGNSLYGILNSSNHSPAHSPMWPAPRYEEVHEADTRTSRSHIHEMDASLSNPNSPALPAKGFK